MNARALAIGAAALAGCGLTALALTAGASGSGSFDESLARELRAAIENDPKDAPSMIRLGMLLLDHGHVDEGSGWLDSAAEVDPTLLEAVMSVQREFKDGPQAGAPVERGGFSQGADVILSVIPGVATFGPVNNVYAYSIGSDTCNIGDQNLSWINDGSPGLGMNAFRISQGRFMQIGLSWVKTACCAFQGSGCGLGCTPGGGLGPGCLDSYGAGWNAIQGNLKSRSNINAWTGGFTGGVGVGGSSVAGLTQVHADDLSAAMHPNPLFFVEGVYVCTEDAAAGNRNNNASYARVNVNNGQISLAGATRPQIPAIYAWRDHGLGLNQEDPAVMIQELDVPDEGRFIVAHKAKDNMDGTWTYDYGVYNLSSDRSGGSFSVPLGDGVVISDIGFHDVQRHSGEGYDNTDWNVTVDADSITWSSPETFAQNANSNAIRWGTMYNFWFTADSGPTDVAAELGLFKPHTPQNVDVMVSAPVGNPCPADFDGDGQVGASDMALLLGAWLTGGPIGDVTGDGIVNSHDLALVLGLWGPC